MDSSITMSGPQGPQEACLVSLSTRGGSDTETSALSSAAENVSSPGTICISGHMCGPIRCLLSTWLLLSQDLEAGKIEVVAQDKISMEDLMEPFGDNCSLLAVSELLIELQLVGAELVAINESSCHGRPLEEVQELMLLLEGDFTIVFCKTDADRWTKLVVLLNPEISGNETTVTADPEDSICEGLHFTREVGEEDPNCSTGEYDSSFSGVSFETPSSIVASTELCLGPLSSSKSAWLQHSRLAEGDRVLSINGKTYVRQLFPEDAQLIVSASYMHSNFLSLLVNTPPSKRGPSRTSWRQSMRKGAVAVGGGAMVGAGVILMVTPLHPLGHAMAIGGVGVLGTEFEQPRRAAKSASNRFANLATSVRRSWQRRRAQEASTAQHTSGSVSANAAISTGSLSTLTEMSEDYQDGIDTRC